jgi:peptidoglycan/LPS O-acetylase OafA/YrhL
MPIAWISWRFIEVPFMKLARLSLFNVKLTTRSSSAVFQAPRD